MHELEDDAPNVYQTIAQEYDSLENIRAALASDVCQNICVKMAEIMPLFKGRLWHINPSLSLFI